MKVIKLIGRTAKLYPLYLVIAPGVLILAGLVLFPLISILYLSFCDWNIITSSPVFSGITNYVRLIRPESGFYDSLYKSLVYAVIAVFFELSIGLFLAMLVEKGSRLIGLLRGLLILPMVMTPVVVGLTWRILYNPTFGLINSILSSLGVKKEILWTSDARIALFSLVIVDIWQNTPFMFLMMTAGLQSLPETLYEVARVEGANAYQTFRYITLPMLRQVMGIAVLLRTIDAFLAFDLIFMITKGGPGTATETLAMKAFHTAFDWLDLGYSAAVCVAMLLVVLLLSIVIIRCIGAKFEEAD